MPDRQDSNADSDIVAAAIFAEISARGAAKTISPEDAAKRIAAERGEDDLGWRKWLPRVRATAKGLAREGRLVIYRKGKPADPDDVKGVIRLGLPRSD
ncbi:MAG TPA: DUF3253 domain-containing protein [Rhodoblastus sp.]|nr:DUF3253 domain-containing protein [Rhodoblastus sp.]